ncbi:MAG: single-stranded-DNA-specific exonuclease RecJ [bacterium]
MQNYSELLQILLKNRGIEEEEEITKFLNPNFEKDLHDPFLMRDMERACVRIFAAIEANEKIVIYADYDADGIPGAVILSSLFKKIGYQNFEVYLPQRNSEGYGLNMSAIEEFRDKNIKLLITIDLGITAIAEVAQAEVDGIDVIITDHHLPHETLPRAYAILNPKVDNYPEKMLCGAGVVFKLIQGFIKKYGEYFDSQKTGQNFLSAELALLKQSSTAKSSPALLAGWEKWMLDMAGLATLSDMVPLLGENRAIAYFGIKVLRKSKRPGLQKLLAKINVDQRYLSEDDIAFMVVPKLNAASRMDDPMRAFELLATNDVVEAGVLANHLTKINDERKLIVAGIMREVKKKFEARETKEVIVVGNPLWRVGVLGLVAGKLMDEYGKPVFVWGKDENDIIKGSCRSPGSVSIVELMTKNKDSFLEYGGHELAGGFTVHPDRIHFLEEILSNSFHDVKRVVENIGEVEGDFTCDLGYVNMKNWKEIEKMAPFGIGNPKPTFKFKNIKIEKIKKFGKNGSGEHLEITFSDVGKNKAVAISFFSGHDSFNVPISEGLNIDLLATLDLSRFRGREELRLRIIEISSTINI